MVPDKQAGWSRKALRAAFAGAGSTLALLVALSLPAFGSVTDTKHNLGSYSPGTVKSPDTTQICIFCHTPHTSAPDSPLWNKFVGGQTYVLYATNVSDDTMVGYVDPPDGNSKLCLTCHDGTIGMGSLLNLPGGSLTGDPSGVLSITGAGESGEMVAGSAANVGIDLSDDHPISFLYSRTYPDNTEFYESTTFSGTGVSLDKDKKVQCTSCHDPHGTDYDDFLVATLVESALCEVCHQKLYWSGGATPIHKTSTATWSGTEGTDPNPWHMDLGDAGYSDDTVMKHACLSCHRGHGGVAGMQLTKNEDPIPPNDAGEEWTCLYCHNGLVATTDIQGMYEGASSSHPVMTTYGKHKAWRDLPAEPAREDPMNLDVTNRHAECVDCHNPHGAESGNHTVGGVDGNTIGPNLIGGWGVKPTGGTWTNDGAGETNIVTSFEVVDFDNAMAGGDNLEGYMCMKCHSYYAYTTTPPDTDSLVNSAVKQSDVSGDFNPNNLGYHPVFAVGKNQPCNDKVGLCQNKDVNPNWTTTEGLSETFVYAEWTGNPGEETGFYRIKHTSTITCTDCHGSYTDTDPKGMHGSLEQWIVRSDEVNGADNFCFNCHRRSVYGDTGLVPDPPENANLSRIAHPVDGNTVAASDFYRDDGVNTGDAANAFGNLCLTCHGGAYAGDLASRYTTGSEETAVINGIHGSNISEDPGTVGDQHLGYRLMNGACVKSYTAAQTGTDGEIVFKTGAELTDDEVCNYDFGTLIIDKKQVEYDCDDPTDCHP